MKSKHVLNQFHHPSGTLPDYLKCAYPDAMKVILAQYHKKGLATQQALDALHHAGLLVGESGRANCDAIAGHQAPVDMADALILLHAAGLLTIKNAQVNRDALTRHSDPVCLAYGLKTLNFSGLLVGKNGQMNRHAIVRHPNPSNVGSAIKMMHTAGLLVGEIGQLNFNSVIQHGDPNAVAYAIKILHVSGLLTGTDQQANRNLVINHKNPKSIAHALSALYIANLLIGEDGASNFQALIIYCEIFCKDTVKTIWHRLPAHQLTSDRFHKMIDIAKQYKDAPELGQKVLVGYVDAFLGMKEQSDEVGHCFDLAQNNHIANSHNKKIKRA